MNQFQEFINKAFENEELMEKVNELSMREPTDEEVIALAAEYGFTITADDLEQQKDRTCSACESGKLEEEDLETVAGGTAGSDRWNPDICMKPPGGLRYECVGFLGYFWCSRFSRSSLRYWKKCRKSGVSTEMFRLLCNIGAFDYIGCDKGLSEAEHYR